MARRHLDLSDKPVPEGSEEKYGNYWEFGVKWQLKMKDNWIILSTRKNKKWPNEPLTTFKGWDF